MQIDINLMWTPKQFNWMPNFKEVHSRTQYDFIEVPVVYFYNQTLPGELNWNKYDENVYKMNLVSDYDMPIIHYFPNRGDDPANALVFFQGRHRTAVAGERYSDSKTKIVVMIERQNNQKVIELLDCRVAESLPRFFPGHDGTLYRLEPLKEVIEK